jgi:acyl-homoserine-lactone acylase
MMYRPVEALEQSFLRTKATDYDSFLKVAELKANSSNNTLFADDKGEVAYLHPQFIPRATTASTTPAGRRLGPGHRLEGPARPVRGAAPEESAQRVADEHQQLALFGGRPLQPQADRLPALHGQRRRDAARGPRHAGAERPQGLHPAEGLVQAAYDPYLTAFADLIPTLAKAYDATPDGDPLKARLGDQMAALKAWDLKWSEGSTETSLAVFWGEALWARSAAQAKADGVSVYAYMAERTTPAQKLAALAEASDRLTADFGDWRTPWGRINRFQRNDGAIVQTFDDDKPSTPVPFTSGQWGSLASFGAKRYPGTKNYYGTSGNSFVAVVEFGPKVKALAVSAGGESGDPTSRHFTDQVQRYAKGDLRPVYFYPEDLKGHVERTYRPGT